MGSWEEESKQDFNLEIVLDSFNKCLGTDNSVGLEDYLCAYQELCRFFKLTGRLFAFVAKDIEYKINSVEHHMHSDYGHHYKTVGSMVEYELDKDIAFNKTPCPSGCRMLLRLHWALEFILAFMKKLVEEDDEAKTSQVAWDVYEKTLAQHHPWLTRQLAYVAVYALPTKKHLISIMCKQDFGDVVILLEKVLTSGQLAYDRVETTLRDSNLLDIP